jgi:AbrB family looped-hinge helix DNA binding protein
MRTTIDAAGRIVVPKTVRNELGFAAGMELELEAVDGHLEITVPSRVRVEEGPRGLRFTADAADPLDSERVRQVIERDRR